MNLNEYDVKVFREIADVLAASITGWFGSGARFDALQTPEVRTFSHSFIARYPFTPGKEVRHLLVKIPHRPNQTGLQAALENETLKQPSRFEYDQLLVTWQAFERLDDPECIATQPLDFLDPWNAIVMLEVQAVPLRAMLTTPQIAFSQPAATERFARHLRSASRWLRHYHEQVGELQTNPISKDLMRARLEKISRDVAMYIGTRYQAPARLETLHEHIETASGQEPVARLHGDFHASNILVTPDNKVCVLDPRVDPGQQSVYEDLSRLMIDLSLKPIPMITGGVFTRKLIEKSRQAVIESYFRPGEFEPELFDFYCACETLFKWSMDERDFSRRKKMRMVAPIARPILSNYMHGLIRRYL